MEILGDLVVCGLGRGSKFEIQKFEIQNLKFKIRNLKNLKLDFGAFYFFPMRHKLVFLSVCLFVCFNLILRFRDYDFRILREILNKSLGSIFFSV